MKKIGFYTVVGLLLWSCEQTLIKDEGTTNPQAVFDDLWQTMHDKYALFDYKHIDWDSLRGVYRPQMQNAHTEKGEFEILSSLLSELQDGHVNLYSPFATWGWSIPSIENLSFTSINRNYAKRGYQVNGGLIHGWLGDGSGIAYIRIEHFNQPIGGIDEVLKKYAQSKGVILDVRDNGGGLIKNAQKLSDRFADKRRLVLKQFYKKGPGHTDFTKGYEVYTRPWGSFYYDKPIVLLSNRRCYSATSYFCVLMKALPRVTMVGDKTGGGSGIPIDYILVNGWRIRFPASYATDAEGVNFESGVPPDLWIETETDKWQQGADPYMATAKKIILGP